MSNISLSQLLEAGVHLVTNHTVGTQKMFSILL
jgi:hypothetical protein